MVLSALGPLALSVAACSTTSVPVPPSDATPEQVVQAYIDAVHAGDCETAAVLVGDRRQSWCGRLDVTSFKVTKRTQERKETASGEDGPMIQRVWVELVSEGGDESFPDSKHDWSYLLDRTGPKGAWRIYDQGMG